MGYNCQHKQEWNIPFGEKIRSDIWSSQAKFQEFIMHRDEGMNL
jgi:hypothetical protein